MVCNQDQDMLRYFLPDYLRQCRLPLKKPFCCLNPNHEDVHPSMSYNAKAQNVHCFACGVTYDLFDLVGMDYGISHFPDKVNQTARLFDISSDTAPVNKLQLIDSGKCCGNSVENHVGYTVKLPDFRIELERLRSSAIHTYDYFLSRGITRESCVQYALFETSDRVYFPLEEANRVTGWCSRTIHEGTSPRYRNSKGSLGIWNGGYLQTDGHGQDLFVTEGIVDAILLEQMGLKAMAVCGSQNGGKLLSRLERCNQMARSWRFVICGDGDVAGRCLNETLSTGLMDRGFAVRTAILPEGMDIGDLYQMDREGLQALLMESNDFRSGYEATSAAADLDDFLGECDRRAEGCGIPTGIDGLDRLLDGGLYPGLYILGAISSLGKTGLALQMADHMATSGRDVLFITLEQSRHELMARSLSRIAAELGGRITPREILQARLGSYKTLLNEVRQQYAYGAKSLFLREGICDIGTAEIREMVREHRNIRGQAPVVIVDYLQILCPQELRATDKQNVDRAVVELKRLSRDMDTPVLCISSFNRENYKSAVSMEAFKESGAVEYSADVLLGLQLMGAGSKDFDVNRAKLKNPRELELVVLKNRMGLPWAKVPIYYDAKYGRFWEAKSARAIREA